MVKRPDSFLSCVILTTVIPPVTIHAQSAPPGVAAKTPTLSDARLISENPPW